MQHEGRKMRVGDRKWRRKRKKTEKRGDNKKNAHVALVSLRLAMDQHTQKANPSAVRLILAAPANSPPLFSKAVKQDSNKDDG